MSARKDREKRRADRIQREAAAQEGERRRRMVQLASGAAFVAIAVVVVLVVISQGQTDGGDSSLEGVAEVRSELRGIPQRGLVLGDPGAKVTLVEFGDLQCPACAGVAEEVLPQLIESKVRGGEAKLEFRNFVVIGDESTPAGAAAIAAGRQGRGWNFVELFYHNQGFERSGYVTDSFLTAVAEGAGVPDIARWNRDRRSKPVLAEVARTTAQAEGLGLGSTPSFALRGPATAGLEPLGPAGSAADLEAAIERAG